MLKLANSFHVYGADLLANYPQIAHEWSIGFNRCTLSVPAQSPSGFDIHFEIKGSASIVNWGNWHSPVAQTKSIEDFTVDLFGLLRDMLSPDMRIRELVAGRSPYRGFLEYLDGTSWRTELEMGLFFWNYFGARSVRTYSNRVLAGRLSN